jgi:hypothetical protein
MITIQELLFNRGLDPKAKIKLVRHKQTGRDLYNLYRYNRHEFFEYQNSQKNDVFKGIDYIVSFIGEGGVKSRFVGVYRITNTTKISTDPDRFIYEMEEVLGFEDLVEKVIVAWRNPISWHQYITNQMPVTEIHQGLHYQQFTDYFDFILDFKELQEIITNQYREWKLMLSATKGIYLISDTKTGKLYVGSAYNEDGIWGRWSSYVMTNGTGGNKTLKELVAEDNNYAYNFQFSILMLLPKTITPDQAIQKERLFKNKLGTNSFGLNNN